MKQEYLGDGVYVTLDKEFQGQIILTANHHEPDQASDVIHLDAQIIELLVRLVKENS